MGLSREQILAQLQRELAGVECVRAIQNASDWIPQGVRAASPNESAALILVAPAAIGEDGSLELPVTPASSSRILAIVTPLGEASNSFGLAPHTPCAKAHRIVTDLAILDVTQEGLVVVELAPGVSAKDVQARVKPTLLISPTVRTMDVPL